MSDERLADALQRGDMVGVNSSDFALLILVDRDGVADVINNEATSIEHVAAALHQLADGLLKANT